MSVNTIVQVPIINFAELDLIPGVGTFVLCLTLPIELGILTGVIVNIIFILYHAARPKLSVEMLKVSTGHRPAGPTSGRLAGRGLSWACCRRSRAWST